MLIDTTNYARITDRVTLGVDAVPVSAPVVDGPYFAVELRNPRLYPLRDDIAPREKNAKELRYREGAPGPAGGPLSPGSRISIEEEAWEVLEPPRDLLLGRRTIGHAQRMQKVRELYPFNGTIQDMDAAFVADTVISFWGGTDDHNDTGEYEDKPAEVPLEAEEFIKLNRVIKVGDKLWKIIYSETDIVSCFINLRLRLAR